MTVRDFIEDVLSMIGVIGQGETIQAKDAAIGLKFLNMTITSFTKAGVPSLVTYTSISDSMTLADGVELALLYNVVATMSFIYGKVPDKYVTDQAALLKAGLI